MAKPEPYTSLPEKPNTKSLYHLPIEILHVVLGFLEPHDILRMRLVCKVFAEIGIQHLVFIVHLVSKSSSFERMLELSRHPIISQMVQSIFYEADMLLKFEDFEAYKGFLTRLAVLRETEDANLQYCLKAIKPQPDRCSDERLRMGYAHYRDYFADQEIILRRNYNSKLLQDAFSRFPNLRSIHLRREGPLSVCSSYMVGEFEAGLYVPYNDHKGHENHGVSQLQSLLWAAVSAGRRLEVLKCDQIYWTFFAQRDDLLAKAHLAVVALKAFELRINICAENFRDHGFHDGRLCTNVRKCTENLQRGPVRRLLVAAPDLEDLAIEVNASCSFEPSIRLSDVIGTYHWRYLKRATFAFLRITEEGLLEFCARHAGTLAHLSLHDILLTSGSWPRMFQQIRKVLRLQSVEISGYLGSWNRSDHHNLDPFYAEDNISLVAWRKPGLQAAIETYLLEGGDAEPINLDPSLYHPDPRMETFSGAYYYRQAMKRLSRTKAELGLL